MALSQLHDGSVNSLARSGACCYLWTEGWRCLDFDRPRKDDDATR